MDFALFVFLNSILFLRPGDFIPDLEGLPIYNVSILTCLVFSASRVIRQLRVDAIQERPITACVLGILGMIFLSDLVRVSGSTAWERGTEFIKIVLYYLLAVGTLDSSARLGRFLTWLAAFAAVLASLSLLHYHGYVNLPALEALERRAEAEAEEDEDEYILQLRGTGMFNDPNDFCIILVAGTVICLWKLFDGAGVSRAVWLAPAGVLLYAIIMTRSRGGFLALVGALMTLFITRFGWRKALPLGVLVLPGLFLLVAGGRQTSISTKADTAQERANFWYDGLRFFASSPVIGIGAGQFAEETGWVAHNSYIHAFAELGFVGGACFTGLFYVPLSALRRRNFEGVPGLDPRLARLRPYLLTLLVGFAAGIFTISRNYVVVTYIPPAVAQAYLVQAGRQGVTSVPRLDWRLIRRMCIAGAATLVMIFITVKISFL